MELMFIQRLDGKSSCSETEAWLEDIHVSDTGDLGDQF